MKSCAPRLVLKERETATRERPIIITIILFVIVFAIIIIIIIKNNIPYFINNTPGTFIWNFASCTQRVFEAEVYSGSDDYLRGIFLSFNKLDLSSPYLPDTVKIVRHRTSF